MRVAMMQPTFLPWLGYFELMFNVDVFVFLDDFQFVTGSWHQRNRLFLNKNVAGWVTVPVRKKGEFGQKINEVQFRDDKPWRKKMWKGIQENYGKAAYFEEYAPVFQKILLGKQDNLAALNIELCRVMASILGCSCKFKMSSELNGVGARSFVVKDLLEKLGANVFYQAQGAFAYMRDDGVFPLSDVKVFFQDAIPKPYRQIRSKNFVPYLSTLDALFNIGADATRKMATSMTEHWLDWEEMVKKC